MYRSRRDSSNHQSVSQVEVQAVASFIYHAGALLLNRSLLKTAFGFINVFIPIFLYQIFGIQFLGIYILMGLVVVFATPISALMLSRFGVRFLMLLSVPLAVAAVLVLSSDMPKGMMGALFAILLGLHTALYWVPYHVDLALQLRVPHRGVITGWYENILEIVGILTPFVGGILIVLTGFQDSLTFVAIVCALSIFPLYFVHEVYERYEWGYFETFRRLFSKKNRSMVLGYAADGAQTAVATILWPVFIFAVFDDHYAAVGLVTSLSMVAILTLNALMGHVADSVGNQRLIKWGVVLSSTGWFFKAFAVTPFHVFVTDTYHKFGDSIVKLSRDITGYSSAADAGHYIDEYTTIAEMAFRVGKVIILIAAGAIIPFFGIQAVFILTGILTTALVVFKGHLSVK
jgi:MFS family permease